MAKTNVFSYQTGEKLYGTFFGDMPCENMYYTKSLEKGSEDVEIWNFGESTNGLPRHRLFHQIGFQKGSNACGIDAASRETSISALFSLFAMWRYRVRLGQRIEDPQIRAQKMYYVLYIFQKCIIQKKCIIHFLQKMYRRKKMYYVLYKKKMYNT